MNVEKRKGARTIKDIPPGILSALNQGTIESANLVEWLAVDQLLLCKNILKTEGRSNYIKSIEYTVSQLKKVTVTSLNETIGTGLLFLSHQENDLDLYNILREHPSDMARCWATFFIGKDERLPLTQLLKEIRFFAADRHFGVREIAWMSIRPRIAKQLEDSIALLTEWTQDPDANIRRFACELTRPRGVWCRHIEQLKQEPRLALPILDALRSDTSRYVQDSVGNWLNDAGKSDATFVIELCKGWELASPSRSTQYIIKKALRTINK